MKNTKTSQMKEKILQAREIQKGLTSYLANEYLPKVREDRAKIYRNPNLTERGQKGERDKLGRKHEVLFLNHVDGQKREYTRLLEEARSMAHLELTREPEKVDELKQKLFDSKLDALRGKISFATNPESALKHLNELVSLADEPALARQINEMVMQLSQGVLSQVTGNAEASVKVRHTLGRIHADLTKRSEVGGEVQAARESLEMIEIMLQGNFVNTSLLGNAITEISKDALEYANDIERYEQVHAERVAEVAQAVQFER
ncbi:hypothetical protein A9498_26925 [Bacillus thuringiensis serovar coreanensis]|nr:hypothetical protein A9498_26925 [Bacillus thuringiensis serovar coreanensis]